jgi:hypothetical protein
MQNSYKLGVDNGDFRRIVQLASSLGDARFPGPEAHEAHRDETRNSTDKIEPTPPSASLGGTNG